MFIRPNQLELQQSLKYRQTHGIPNNPKRRANESDFQPDRAYISIVRGRERSRAEGILAVHRWRPKLKEKVGRTARLSKQT